MSDDFDLRNPDSFVAGTVGPPGQRIFFLQVRESGHVISLKLEKAQVWALGNLLAELLESEGYEGPAARHGALAEPVAAAWTVGRVATGMDTEAKVIVIIAEEITDEDLADDSSDGDPDGDSGIDPVGATGAEDDDPFDPDSESSGGRARIHLDYPMALGFATQAMALVEDGRDFGMRNGHRPPSD